jgi:hypothetical protein
MMVRLRDFEAIEWGGGFAFRQARAPPPRRSFMTKCALGRKLCRLSEPAKQRMSGAQILQNEPNFEIAMPRHGRWS